MLLKAVLAAQAPAAVAMATTSGPTDTQSNTNIAESSSQ